jgi:hypothetical protein
MNKFIYILAFLMSISFAVNAQQKKYVYVDSSYIEEPEVVSDTVITQKIEVAPSIEEYTKDEEESIEYIDTALYYKNLLLEKDSVVALKNNKSFAYVKYLDSLLKEQQEKKEKPKPKKEVNLSWLDKFFASSFLQIFLWTLAILFVLFILYKLFFTKGVFQRNTKKYDTVAEQIVEEVINADTNFDKLITQAETEGNYRLAVRYQYLKILNQLAKQNIIQLANDKTNYQYVQEISDEVRRNAFAKITLNYEYVWYGEFEIDNILYQQLKSSFNNFSI